MHKDYNLTGSMSGVDLSLQSTVAMMWARQTCCASNRRFVGVYINWARFYMSVPSATSKWILQRYATVPRSPLHSNAVDNATSKADTLGWSKQLRDWPCRSHVCNLVPTPRASQSKHLFVLSTVDEFTTRELDVEKYGIPQHQIHERPVLVWKPYKTNTCT